MLTAKTLNQFRACDKINQLFIVRPNNLQPSMSATGLRKRCNVPYVCMSRNSQPGNDTIEVSPLSPSGRIPFLLTQTFGMVSSWGMRGILNQPSPSQRFVLWRWHKEGRCSNAEMPQANPHTHTCVGRYRP